MTRKNKKLLIRIIISSILFIIFLILFKTINLNKIWDNEYNFYIPFAIFFLIYLIIGYDILRKCFLNIIHLHFLDETFLMTIATIGAFSLGIYSGYNNIEIEGFDEACAVMIFFQIGELFQSVATTRSRKNVSKLMNLRPDIAYRLNENNEIEKLSPYEINVGDIIVVMPGERVVLDGILLSDATFDTKTITGESEPLDLKEGDNVLSGFINNSNKINIKVTSPFKESTIYKILELVENASNHKSKTENFITKFAKFYTPIVVLLALLIGIIPSIITKDFNTWIYRALCFLVVSCPCALVISVPLAFFIGIGVSSKNGILVKGSNYLELYNKANIFIFDKTGTITKGKFKITEVYPDDSILKYAKIAEAGFNHPIAKSISEGETPNLNYSKEMIHGEGIIARNKDEEIICGNYKIMERFNIKYDIVDNPFTIIHVALDKKYLGYIIIEDEIKEESINTIEKLNTIGKTYMLTGDNKRIAENISERVGINVTKSNLLPQEKVYEVENIIKNKDDKDVIVYTGDGINDAPVLMMSDIGISMGKQGDDAALEASDIVIMDDDLSRLNTLKKISKRLMMIVYENIIFAIGVKVLILILAAFGIGNMWLSVFGDVGVSVLAILNSMRVNKNYEK